MEAAAEKFPPPFRWFKRILIGYAILIPALVGTWYGWSWYAKRALQQQIAAAHARGEPVEAEDFDRLLPNVEPAKNAALHYELAMSLCVWTAAQEAWYDSRVPNSPLDYDAAGSITNTCQAGLKEAYVAAALPQANWSFLPSNDIRGIYRSLSPFRRLANTLRFAAEYHHHIHDDAAALRDAAAQVHLADSLRPGSTLVENLVAVGVEAAATQTLMEILPDLSIGEGDRQASPMAVRNLKDRLLNDKDRIPDRMQSWYGERAFWAFYSDSGRGYTSPWSSLLGGSPVRTLARARNFILLTTVADAAGQAFYHDMHPICDWPPKLLYPESIAEDATSVWDESLDDFRRAVVLEQRSLADRRLAACAIAIRLFRVDQPAARFGSLDDLVPRYLAEIPADPFAPDHHAIRYQPAGEVPRLYSVNDDGMDDHGSLRDKSGNIMARTRTIDLTFYLDLWTPPIK